MGSRGRGHVRSHHNWDQLLGQLARMMEKVGTGRNGGRIEGRLAKTMKRFSTRLGLAQRVHFLGYRCDVPALTRVAVAVLVTSGREGLSHTVLEAMAPGGSYD